MYITYSQKCVFSRNHTIKKKKTSKKGGGKWISPTFQPKKPQKSTQRHPGEDHAPGRDHIARTLGRSTAPSGTRGGDWAETDRVQNSKRRKFRSLEKAKKKTFWGDSCCFGVFEDGLFFHVFPNLWLCLVMVVFGCFRFNCWWFDHVFVQFQQAYAPDVTSFIACHLATFVAWLKTCSYQRSFWMKENRGE